MPNACLFLIIFLDVFNPLFFWHIFLQQGQTPYDIALSKRFEQIIQILGSQAEGTLPAPPLVPVQQTRPEVGKNTKK